MTYKPVAWAVCVQGAANPALYMQKVRDLTCMRRENPEGVLMAPVVGNGFSRQAVPYSLWVSALETGPRTGIFVCEHIWHEACFNEGVII